MSFWESRGAIEAFAGQDIGTAVFYPDDDRFLIERDLTASHYKIAGTEQVSFKRPGRAPRGTHGGAQPLPAA